MSLLSIDLDGLRSGSAAARRRIADDIDTACRTNGFLRITGHGVDASLIDEMLDTTAGFFDLPAAEKQRWTDPIAANNRGYAALGTEALGYSHDGDVAAPDLFEAFNVGREAVGAEHPDHAYFDTYRSFFAANVWPDTSPDLREVWLRYMAAVDSVNDRLLEAFAVALDLDDDFFLARTRRAIKTMRAINYERRPGSPDPLPGQLRMGQHTDYGIITVLLADPVPGLQVFHEGGWLDVVPEPGEFIVNIGDMLATWTNDRWVSTLHRVVPPPTDVTGAARRRSVAHFLEADPDAVISCLPTCVDADHPARYQPVEAGEYLLAKLLGPRELRPSEVPGRSQGGSGAPAR